MFPSNKTFSDASPVAAGPEGTGGRMNASSERAFMEREMVGSPDPRDPKPDDPIMPEPTPLPELPELDPVPEDGTPSDHGVPEPEDAPFVPPPGTQ